VGHGVAVHRGVKSKPEDRWQLGWCIFELERSMAAQARMDGRSCTGFRPNDEPS